MPRNRKGAGFGLFLHFLCGWLPVEVWAARDMGRSMAGRCCSRNDQTTQTTGRLKRSGQAFFVGRWLCLWNSTAAYIIPIMPSTASAINR